VQKFLTTVTRYLAAFIFFSVGRTAYAQTSYNDSLYFTTVFQNPVYQNYYDAPGIFYIHPFVQTRAGLFDSLDNLMKFNGEEYYGAYNSMRTGELYPIDSINNTLNYYYSLSPEYAYKQKDPVWGLTFSLNGKTSTTYCTYTPTANPDHLGSNRTAILFITGSDPNNGTEMVRGEGYQNDYGFQKDTLATVGDVFIAIRPLNDFRNFVWDRFRNPMALNSEFPIPSQITSYLSSRGTPFGVNSLIESIALVKYLKTRYQRVVIAGLSYGGQYTTLNAFESAPEGALISGGYTILVDQTPQTNDYQIASFGSLFYSLNRDSVKNNIGKSTTQFLFSWGRVGDIYEESYLHETQNYFSALTNTQYFYDYDQHSFPPFQAFKNLFASIKMHTSVRIRELVKTCSPATAKIMITFLGQKPYHFDIYKDSLLYNSYISEADTFYVDINKAGIYKVKNLYDNNNMPGYNSDDYIFKPNSDIDIEVSNQKWQCNSIQKNEFQLTGGKGPWDIYYRENGIPGSKIFYKDDHLKFLWPDGIYIIDSINNYGNCMKYINDTIVVNSKISEPDKLFSTIFFNRDSAKPQLILKDYFNGYKKIFFIKDGLKDSADIENNTIFVTNGNYQFTEIKNDSDCSYTLNVHILITHDSTRFLVTSSSPALVAYPNPFAKQFNLLIELPSNKSAALDIFDEAGKKIKSLEIVNGINIVNMEGIIRGVYILKVRFKSKGYSFDTLEMIKL